jgi:hypothetical protein
VWLPRSDKFFSALGALHNSLRDKLGSVQPAELKSRPLKKAVSRLSSAINLQRRTLQNEERTRTRKAYR